MDCLLSHASSTILSIPVSLEYLMEYKRQRSVRAMSWQGVNLCAPDVVAHQDKHS